MSDFIPNTFQTPNAIVDKLMFLLTDSEFRVLMYMVRHILGWQRKADTRRACISLSNFADGFSYETPDGTISYPGCGLGVNPIRNALKALQKYRIVEAIGKPKAIGQEWELRFMTKDDVDFVGLQLRQDKKLRNRKKQTESARKVSPKNTGVSVEQIEPQGISPTDSQGISPTDSQGISPTDNNETHSKYHGKEQKDSAPTARIVEKPIDDTTPLSSDDYKSFIALLEKPFKLYGGRVHDVYHQLRGTGKDVKSKRYQYGAIFRDKPVDLTELKRFVVWYPTQCTGCDYPIAADTLEDWFGKFRAIDAQRTKELDLQQRNVKRPLNFDQLESA